MEILSKLDNPKFILQQDYQRGNILSNSSREKIVFPTKKRRAQLAWKITKSEAKREPSPILRGSTLIFQKSRCILFPIKICYTILNMETTVLNYRIIIDPDEQTGTEKPGFTALCPTLGVADDGDTIEEALKNIRGAIKAYVDSLIEDNLPVPVDQPDKDIVTTAQIDVTGRFQPAF